MAEEEKAPAEQQKSGGGNLVLIIIIVLLFLLLIGGAVAGYFLLTGDEESAAQEQIQSTKQEKQVVENKKSTKRSSDYLTIGPMYPLDKFIVNLLSESGGRYLKTSLDLELEAEELSAEMDTKKSLVRDLIIRSLSAKTYEEISTIRGKEKLKDEIVVKINDVLADGQIKNLFFTDFVIQ